MKTLIDRLKGPFNYAPRNAKEPHFLKVPESLIEEAITALREREAECIKAKDYMVQLSATITEQEARTELHRELIAKQEARIDELEEELECERINNEDLANATYYKGNSVSSWWSKATNYKKALGETWDALRAAGVTCDGKKNTADGVRELQARITELERLKS